MKSLRINIILPFPVTKPVGGAKVMYEYAKELHARGHKIVILHTILRPYKKMKSPLWWKKMVYTFRGASRPSWFPLHKDITSMIVNEISDKYVPEGDIVFSTWWQMAYAINQLSPSKGIKVNLIQDYELWIGQEQKVHESYALPIHHVTIANYLKKILDEHNPAGAKYIPVAIDTDRFTITVPIEDRNPHSIIMMYSEEPRKGTKYGLEALISLKQKFADLKVTLFSVYNKPPDLPNWIEFYTKPQNLPELFNNHAIFFSPSLGEGWALPPAESMASGCAVVLTEIGGHADYGFHEKTALLVDSKNPVDIVVKLERLLSNNDERINLAKAANTFLTQNFTWARSTQLMEQYFYQLTC